jgi:hypothetical protein
MSWTRPCWGSGPRKIVRPASNLRTDVQLTCVGLVPRSARRAPLATERRITCVRSATSNAFYPRACGERIRNRPQSSALALRAAERRCAGRGSRRAAAARGRKRHQRVHLSNGAEARRRRHRERESRCCATIVAFLMVFLIQNSQNRDAAAHPGETRRINSRK